MLGDASISDATWPSYFFLGRGLASCLRITRPPLRYLRCHGRWAPFLYYGRSGALLGCYIAHLFRQDCAFFLPRLANDRFPAADVQCDPAILLSVLPAPPISSPCLDANEETDLQAICSTPSPIRPDPIGWSEPNLGCSDTD